MTDIIVFSLILLIVIGSVWAPRSRWVRAKIRAAKVRGIRKELRDAGPEEVLRRIDARLAEARRHVDEVEDAAATRAIAGPELANRAARTVSNLLEYRQLVVEEIAATRDP